MLMMALCRVAPGAPAQRIQGCSVASIQGSTVTLNCRNHAQVRLQVITPAMVRVRVSAHGEFAESLPERWGFVKEKWPAVPVKTDTTKDALWIETSASRSTPALGNLPHGDGRRA